MRDVAIVSAVRTAVGRAPKGAFENTRPDDLAALVIREALRRAEVEPAGDRGRRPRLRAARGRAGPERRAPGRLPRRAARRASPAMTINRFCSSGLQATSIVADRIARGRHRRGARRRRRVDVDVPMGGSKLVAQPARSSSSSRTRTRRWATPPRTSRASSASAAAIRTRSRSRATRRRWRRRARGDFDGRDRAGEDARVRRRGLAATSPSTRTRARAPTRRSRSWRRSSRCSIRPAPSPPATARRSTTARRRSC